MGSQDAVASEFFEMVRARQISEACEPCDHEQRMFSLAKPSRQYLPRTCNKPRSGQVGRVGIEPTTGGL
jgi:hypothetical protein